MSTLQINKTKYRHFKIAAIGSGAALALGGLAFFQPLSLADNSYAETTSSSSAKMSVNLEPSIAIWTTDTSDNTITAASIAASPDESVATTAIRAHVSTNNPTGYTLTIQSNSTDAKMKHENTSITKTINPLTGSGTSSSSWANNSSLNNMWGYSIGSNDSFVGVPGSSSTATTIDSTDAPNNDNYTDITFATKADLSLPAGTYKDTVVFSAVTNIAPTTKSLKLLAHKNNITTMQNLTADVCTDADIWETTADDLILTDTRDDNAYIVRKLKDGNCWMTQNLRLDLSTETTLTPDDTNITANWTPDRNTQTTSESIAWNTDRNGDGKITEVDVTAADTNTARSYHVGSGMEGDTQSDNLIYGNYYNWYAATAGGGTYEASSWVSISSSICPKNWRIPLNYGVRQSWGVLLNDSYGLADYTPSHVAIAQSEPLSLTPSGGYSRHSGKVAGQGQYAVLWTSRPSQASRALNLFTGLPDESSEGRIVTTNYGLKSDGDSVRCVLSSE